MKILVVADLHYSLKQLDWVKSQASRFDLIVIAGDLLDMGSGVDLDVQIVVIEKYLKQFSTQNTVLISSGNHDLNDISGTERVAAWLEESKSERVLVDWDSIDIQGNLFTICPWWDGPVTRQLTEQILLADAAKAKKNWIWLHHNPPDNTPVSWNGKTYCGDPDLIHWIETYRPDFILSGHIHNSPFYAGGSWLAKVGSAWVFNPGKQIGPKPTCIILDPDARKAAWSSIEGEASRDLA